MNAVRLFRIPIRLFSSIPVTESKTERFIRIGGVEYRTDDYTNVTPKIISHVGRDLYNTEGHPLCLIKKKIAGHFYFNYRGRNGTPIFSIHDTISPVVTTTQNFDSLLIPEDHVSRKKSDCYYINRKTLLRGHTTAHQSDLIRYGLDSFLIFGDVYRRDQIDATHYPVFHQLDGVRIFSKHQLADIVGCGDVSIFESGAESCSRQGCHTDDATQIVVSQLKTTLVSLAQYLFPDCETQWVDAYFPFTHPSMELEIRRKGEKEWMELLGCGVIRNDILQEGGAKDRIGWAFGIGVDRLAMLLYSIPDIRLFWSTDTGFTSQFWGKSPDDSITYKPVSVYPQCKNDMSFWLPSDRVFEPNDFYEIVREIGGDIVEQIVLQDEWKNPKNGNVSHCYRIIYRHHSRTLTQDEVNDIHSQIAAKVTSLLGVTIR